jgi:hypothetical protein
MDPKVAEKLVNDVLALKVRTPQTVVECVGVEFAEQFEHLTVMLCERKPGYRFPQEDVFCRQ